MTGARRIAIDAHLSEANVERLHTADSCLDVRPGIAWLDLPATAGK